jgi:hypothetical protein
LNSVLHKKEHLITCTTTYVHVGSHSVLLFRQCAKVVLLRFVNFVVTSDRFTGHHPHRPHTYNPQTFCLFHPGLGRTTNTRQRPMVTALPVSQASYPTNQPRPPQQTRSSPQKPLNYLLCYVDFAHTIPSHSRWLWCGDCLSITAAEEENH